MKAQLDPTNQIYLNVDQHVYQIVRDDVPLLNQILVLCTPVIMTEVCLKNEPSLDVE